MYIDYGLTHINDDICVDIIIRSYPVEMGGHSTHHNSSQASVSEVLL
jgi:hypothetical protein